MIVTNRQDELATWLCTRIGLVPSPHLVCIGTANSEGRIAGVVGYDGYNGASIQMHSAGEGNWLTRELLRVAFDYPFNQCKVNMVIGLVPSGNVQALKFNTHIGFTTKCILEGAHPDGYLALMTMYRRECRYLRKEGYGQEKRTPAST